jgi:hypothetical protein
MIEMSKQRLLKGALILFLSTGPSIACDPEEMINELRAQCREGIASVAVLIEPLKPRLTMSERASVLEHVTAAGPNIGSGDEELCHRRPVFRLGEMKMFFMCLRAPGADIRRKACARMASLSLVGDWPTQHDSRRIKY